MPGRISGFVGRELARLEHIQRLQDARQLTVEIGYRKKLVTTAGTVTNVGPPEPPAGGAIGLQLAANPGGLDTATAHLVKVLHMMRHFVGDDQRNDRIAIGAEETLNIRQLTEVDVYTHSPKIAEAARRMTAGRFKINRARDNVYSSGYRKGPRPFLC